jgi:hypothetical protein
LRFVAGLDELGARISDGVVEVEHVDFVTGGIAVRRGGGDAIGLDELFDLGHERAGLLELNRVAVVVEEVLEKRLLRADQRRDPRLDSLFADKSIVGFGVLGRGRGRGTDR